VPASKTRRARGIERLTSRAFTIWDGPPAPACLIWMRLVSPVEHKMKYLLLAARLLIGGLFVYASLHKIVDPAAFAQAIRNYQMIPPEWTNFAALILPWIELIAGGLLVLGILTRPSALIITSLMAVFLVALFYAYATGLDIDCGCFTTDPLSPGRISPITLVRDSSLFVLSLVILVADRGDFSIMGSNAVAARS
jgi:putative oxidoreductase